VAVDPNLANWHHDIRVMLTLLTFGYSDR